MAENKKNNISRIILASLWWLVVALLAIVLISVLGAKFKGEVPNICGYSVMRIVSGSMEPEISTGEYILVKKTPPHEIEQGQIISFYSEDKAIYGLPNTHRVVERVNTESGLEFVTKGDASPINDTVNAKEEKLIGVYVAKLEWLTRLSGALNGNGMFILFIVLQMGVFAIIIYSYVKKRALTYEEAVEADSKESED